MPFRLSCRASAFLRESIRSLDELETILLLQGDASRWWSAEQIARTLGISIDAATRVLEALAARNLLDVRVGESLSYCWAPVHEHVLETLREVALKRSKARELVMVSSPNVSRSGRVQT
jgi:DNA-binding transcriptional MocR family regulator